MDPFSKTKPWQQWILVLGFGLVVLLPAMGSLTHWQKHSLIDENRPLATFPKWRDDPRIWQEYRKQLETYFDDHLGFRDWFIATELRFKHTCFPAEAGPEVVMGRDGWMYFRRDGTIDTVEDRLGLVKFPESLLKYWQETIEKRRDAFAARGIKYLYVIAPNKESVYPEHLPDWLKPGAPTKADQLVAYLRLHSTVPVLDLRPVLRAAREPNPLYYKTDSHWNLMGAFFAAETIITNLSGQIPSLTPLTEADFDIQRVPGANGDLARIAGFPEWLDDNRYVFTPKPYLPRLKFVSPETNQIDWARIGTLPVAGNVTITTLNPQRSLKLNIYGDSFSVALQSFLAFHFGKVTLVKYAFDKMPDSQNPPDVVLDVMIERYFR